MFDSLLIPLFQLQGSWHIMQLTGILAAETACLLHKVRKYSLSMSRNDPNFIQTDFDKRYQVYSYPSPKLWHYLYLETSSNQRLGSVFEVSSFR